MKYIHVYVLSLMVIFLAFCEQSQTDSSKDKTKSTTNDAVPSHRSNDSKIHTKHEYTNSIGKRLVIQNSLPKAGPRYTDPNGKEYVYAVFWTRIINETENPIEVTIDFPIDSFQIPSASGLYMKLLLPSDTMTIDKEFLYDYGLEIKSFLDNYRYKSSSLKRIIHPKSSSAFYVVALSNRGVDGVLRTELSLKGSNLFYKINDKEIPCGSISLKKLRTGIDIKLIW
jgi:hypothetical protein